MDTVDSTHSKDEAALVSSISTVIYRYNLV